MSGITPTQRTLKALRAQGMVCGMVEKWVPVPTHPGGGFRKDLFGFIDILALDPHRGIVAIQSCGQAFSEHYKKITDSECTPDVFRWLTNPSRPVLELWSWRKLLKKRGGKMKIWAPRVYAFKIEDLV